MTQCTIVLYVENYRDFMDKYTYTFASTENSWDYTVLLFTALAVLSMVILIAYYLKSEKSFVERIKSPFGLLFLTMVIATASSAFYTIKNSTEADKVIITDTSITTPFGSCKFTNIKDASYVNVPVEGKTDSTQFLLIEEYTGKAHPIYGGHYDIDAILSELKKHLAEKIQ